MHSPQAHEELQYMRDCACVRARRCEDPEDRITPEDVEEDNWCELCIPRDAGFGTVLIRCRMVEGSGDKVLGESIVGLIEGAFFCFFGGGIRSGKRLSDAFGRYRGFVVI